MLSMIKKIVYNGEYEDDLAKELLEESNIEIVKYKKYL